MHYTHLKNKCLTATHVIVVWAGVNVSRAAGSGQGSLADHHLIAEEATVMGGCATVQAFPIILLIRLRVDVFF